MYEQYFVVWSGEPAAAGHDGFILKRICKGVRQYENNKEKNYD